MQEHSHCLATVNGLYAQVGAERGRFALLARGGVRISESSGEDDNPDIEDYLGHGDLVASYAIGRHQLSVSRSPTGSERSPDQ